VPKLEQSYPALVPEQEYLIGFFLPSHSTRLSTVTGPLSDRTPSPVDRFWFWRSRSGKATKSPRLPLCVTVPDAQDGMVFLSSEQTAFLQDLTLPTKFRFSCPAAVTASSFGPRCGGFPEKRLEPCPSPFFSCPLLECLIKSSARCSRNLFCLTSMETRISQLYKMAPLEKFFVTCPVFRDVVRQARYSERLTFRVQRKHV